MPQHVFIIPDSMLLSINNEYQSLGYPLGKSRKGFKKWLKRYILNAMTALAIKEILDNA